MKITEALEHIGLSAHSHFADAPVSNALQQDNVKSVGIIVLILFLVWIMVKKS